ncbi:MAG: flagellar filament capping protein FliD [Methylophaga sp.]|nr:flagellar filament capping protein FliD [Methylophaga sp.]
MAITAGGIGSGLDIESLVSQLVAAEGQPTSFRLDRKEADHQADLSAYGTLKSALSTFQDSVEALDDLESFQGRLATSSDSDLFTASADTTAVAGSYDIEVIQLAEAAKLRSGDFTSATEVVGTGTLDITLGTDTFQITVDTNNQTLEGIRDAINAASDNPGVAASIINVDDGAGGTVSRLILTSDKIGSANNISIAATDDDLNNTDTSGLSRLATANLTTIQAAQDSIIFVDQQQVTRSSNTFSDVITGISFTLEKADVGTTETLTVAFDKDGVTSKVNSFINSYNTLIDTMNSLASYDADSGASGPLIGDSVLRGVKSQIRQQITSSISGLEFGTLSEIGVTTNDTGKLSLDSSKLDEVLTSNFTAVSQLFASDNGLAKSLSGILDGYVDADGIISARTDGLQTRIESLTGDRERLGQRLVALEARLRAQFTAMDILVAQLNSTSNFLTSQLANLPKPNSIRSNN